MIPKPRSGEVDIEGDRWSWCTVGHARGSPCGRRSRLRWTIRFIETGKPENRCWCEMTDIGPDELTSRALRKLFRTAADGSSAARSR